MFLRIRQERLKRDWSQGDLAERAKITAAELSRFENRLQIPYPIQLERLSQVLNVPKEDLFKKVPGKPLSLIPRQHHRTRVRNQEKILAAIGHTWMSLASIERTTGLGSDAVRRHTFTLLEDGKLERILNGKRFVYRSSENHRPRRIVAARKRKF